MANGCTTVGDHEETSGFSFVHAVYESIWGVNQRLKFSLSPCVCLLLFVIVTFKHINESLKKKKD